MYKFWKFIIHSGENEIEPLHLVFIYFPFSFAPLYLSMLFIDLFFGYNEYYCTLIYFLITLSKYVVDFFGWLSQLTDFGSVFSLFKAFFGFYADGGGGPFTLSAALWFSGLVVVNPFAVERFIYRINIGRIFVLRDSDPNAKRYKPDRFL